MAEWPTTSVTSAEIVDGSIVDADVAAGAAIQVSKLSGVETPAGAQSKADAAQANAEATAATDATTKADAAEASAVATAATDATTKANAAQSGAEATAAAALSAHNALTDTAHGLPDTSTLIVEGDARLTDARTPTAHTHAPAEVTGTAVITTDSRLSDARTPTAHASSHQPGGSDGIDLETIYGKGSTLPTLPNAAWPAGAMFYRTTDLVTYRSYGSGWDPLFARPTANSISGFGLAAARPAATAVPSAGYIWFSTDTKEVSRSDKVSWTLMGLLT